MTKPQIFLRLLLSAVSLQFFFSTSFAQEISFEKLSNTSGLTQNSVTSISQDSAGFLWFGTYDGLNRYDGYNFKAFKKDLKSPLSISHNFIRTLLVDRDGLLWIGTLGGGVNLYNHKNEQFISYQYNPDDSAGISHNLIYTLFQDSHGNIWIGTLGGGLNKIENAQKPTLKSLLTGPVKLKCIRFTHDPENPESLSSNKITSLFEDTNGHLWVGTRLGINIIDPVENRILHHYYHDTKKTNSLSTNNITSICGDTKGNIWIGTGDKGLIKFDTSNQHFYPYQYQYDPNDITSISHNSISALFRDKSGHVWVGTRGNGLNLLLTQTDKKRSNQPDEQFLRYQHSDHDPQSISGNSIFQIFEDRTGILWIATDWNGINKYDPNINKFPHYQSDTENPDGLNDNAIFSLYKDSHDILWIGTRSGGLNTYNLKTKQYSHFVHDPEDPHSISNNTVRDIYEDQSGTLWIGTETGLNQLNRSTQEFNRYFHNPEDPAATNIYTIHATRDGYLWLGNWGVGLTIFNLSKHQFLNPKQLLGESPDIRDETVWSIVEDTQGYIWIGTDQTGIYRIDEENKLYDHFLHNPENNNSLSDNKVLTLFPDTAGLMWAGTTVGLNQISFSKDVGGPVQIKRYTVDNGLFSNIVRNIIKDKHGNLWLNNGDHLTIFNPATREIQGYDITKRLKIIEFGIHSTFKDDKTGVMYIGGINGFTIFHPDSIKNNHIIPGIKIVKLKIFNREIQPGQIVNGKMILENSIIETDQIILSYKDNVISFEFAALSFNDPESNQYAYRLEGFEKEWNYIGNKREVTYTNLDPGKYLLRVIASNNDGVWNNTGASLSIIITPPFWETFWFRLFFLLLIIGIIYAGYEFRLQSIKRQQHTLETQVKERTADLEFINQELIKQKQAIQKYARDLQHSNEELEQFAYVASHDLQEPLRMVSSYLSLLVKRHQEKLDEEALEFIHYAADGAGRMRRLINDLLSYSRVTSKRQEFTAVDCERMLKHVEMNLKVITEDKQALISHSPLPIIRGDEMQVERLLQNLIGNAIKYSDQVPMVHVSAERKDKIWEFAIKDNGIGIDPSQFERIFGIFQRLHHKDTYTGTGIGLAVCKKIVERHNGRIWVESKPGKGSTFYFTLPALPQ